MNSMLTTVAASLPFIGWITAARFCWGHPLTWLGPSLIYTPTPIAVVATLKAHRRAVGRARHWSLLLVAVTMAQFIVIAGITIVGAYYHGLLYFANVFGVQP